MNNTSGMVSPISAGESTTWMLHSRMMAILAAAGVVGTAYNDTSVAHLAPRAHVSLPAAARNSAACRCNLP
jgi:hypothetical protein